MIDETLPVSYALLPFGEGAEIACESAGLGYLLGKYREMKNESNAKHKIFEVYAQQRGAREKSC